MLSMMVLASHGDLRCGVVSSLSNVRPVHGALARMGAAGPDIASLPWGVWCGVLSTAYGFTLVTQSKARGLLPQTVLDCHWGLGVVSPWLHTACLCVQPGLKAEVLLLVVPANSAWCLV